MKALCQGDATTSKLKYLLNSAKCASVCLQRLIHSSWCRRRQRFLCCNRNWSVWGLQSQTQQSTDPKLNEDPHPHHPASERPALRQIKHFSFWSTYFPNKLNGVNLETPQLWAVMENRADILSTSDITEKEHKGVKIPELFYFIHQKLTLLLRGISFSSKTHRRTSRRKGVPRLLDTQQSPSVLLTFNSWTV